MPSKMLQAGGPDRPSPCAVELMVKETVFKKPKTCKISARCKNTTHENRQGVEIVSNREGVFGGREVRKGFSEMMTFHLTLGKGKVTMTR